MLIKILGILIFLQVINSRNVDYTQFLEKYGYLPRGTNQLSSKHLSEALKTMQRMAGLEETGELDERTEAMMRRPRCGYPDVSDHQKRNDNRLKRRVAQQYKWEEKIITYRCAKPAHGSRISYDDLRRTMYQAANQWSSLADIEIVESGDEKSMIEISAGRAMHSPCTVPFDSITLAHAFFPPNGRIHVNENVQFAMTNYTQHYGVNSLYSVVAHELGHALGFEHSPDSNSIMFAYDTPRKWVFTTMDRYKMQLYYGARKDVTVPDPQTTVATIPTLGEEIEIERNEEVDEIIPNECKVEKPIIVFYRDEFFVFKSSWVWRISSDWKRLISKPVLIDHLFRGLPSPIDAAVTVDRNLWVFVGQHIYVISDTRILHTPLSLSELGIPETSVDLVYEWHYFNPPAIYIWKGKQYWRLDEKMYYRKVDERYPKSVDLNWARVPKNIDSAFTYQKEIHFLRDNMIYRMNSSRSIFDIADGFPKSLDSFLQFCPRTEKLQQNNGLRSVSKLFLLILILNF